MPTNGEISLYFHIPFCSKKCPYCHFYVLPDEQRFKNQLLSALKLEWSAELPKLQNKKIVSIYFGGGTPSLFGAESLSAILNEIFAANLEIATDCEITIEANPENVTPSLMRDFAGLGINRVSIGVQSLDNSSLNVLERTHNANRAIAAIQNTHDAGIRNISIDLMYDLPGQTFESWERTLQGLNDLSITHLSLYNLTIEPHTAFYKRQKILKPLLPTAELSLLMLEKAVLLLEEQGLDRYEISAFAKPGFQSRHNTGYWTGRPFLGFGPSAFSYWDSRRFQNIPNLSRYAQALASGQSPVGFEEELPYPSNIKELLAVRLRLLEGADLRDFSLTAEMEEDLNKLLAEDFLEKIGGCIRLTKKGLLFYDSVASAII